MLPFDNKTKPVSVNNENNICSKPNYFLILYLCIYSIEIMVPRI